MTRRDYGSEYERRVEAAIDAGWDSFYQQRQGRADARETAEEMGVDWDRQQIDDYAEFVRDFDEGVYDRDALRDIFDDYFPDGSDNDFYDWLGELYDSVAG